MLLLLETLLIPALTKNYCSSCLFSYINYSNIAARLLRRSLKKEFRVEAQKRDESHIKFTPWANGKPVRTLIIRIDLK